MIKDTLKSVFLTVLIVLSFGSNGHAQDEALLNKKFKNWERIEPTKSSAFSRIVSIDLQASIMLMEMFFSSKRDVTYISEIDGSDVNFSEQSSAVGLFGFAVAPRFNLYQDGKKAFGIRTAASLSLSVVEYSLINSGATVGHFTYGASAFCAFGLGGTYNNVNNRGVLIGLGVLNLRAPIKGIQGNFELAKDSPRPGMWTLPYIHFDIYRRGKSFKRSSNINFNLGYWSSSLYYRIALGMAF